MGGKCAGPHKSSPLVLILFLRGIPTTHSSPVLPATSALLFRIYFLPRRCDVPKIRGTFGDDFLACCAYIVLMWNVNCFDVREIDVSLTRCIYVLRVVLKKWQLFLQNVQLFGVFNVHLFFLSREGQKGEPGDLSTNEKLQKTI